MTPATVSTKAAFIAMLSLVIENGYSQLDAGSPSDIRDRFGDDEDGKENFHTEVAAAIEEAQNGFPVKFADDAETYGMLADWAAEVGYRWDDEAPPERGGAAVVEEAGNEWLDLEPHKAYEVSAINGPVACSDCGWQGKTEDLDPIGECAISAGDASPAGRCPECDSVAYLDRPKDRAADKVGEVLEPLAQFLKAVQDEVPDGFLESARKQREALEQFLSSVSTP